jgi:transposase
MSIDSLCTFIQREKRQDLYDGSIYVFYNKGRDKIKCLFWDRNGFVLYYKRLDKCKFKIREMFNNVEMISGEDLEIMLSGFEPKPLERMPIMLEHNNA